MKKQSLNTKISVIISILIIGSITIASIGIREMGEINSHLNHIIDNSFTKIVHTKDLRILMESQLNRELELVQTSKKHQQLSIKQNLNDNHIKILELLDKEEALATQDAENIQDLKKAYLSWWEHQQEILDYLKAGEKEEAYLHLQKYSSALRSEIKKNIRAIEEFNKNAIDAELIETKELYSLSKDTIIFTSVCTIILSLVIAFLVLRKISITMKKVIESLTSSAREVSSVSGQVSIASKELAEATTEQATSVEQTATAIVELNSTIQATASNSSLTATKARSSEDNAMRGQEHIKSLLKAMSEIDKSNHKIIETVKTNNNELNSIIDVIEEINAKTNVINEIVFQTKLLSLNASVEAARAGSAGNGFSAVAEEIGKLAAVSGAAAKEIETLLESSVGKVDHIIKSSQESIQSIVEINKDNILLGNEIANECHESFVSVVNDIQEINQMSESISCATTEQASGVEEINQTISMLDNVTKVNASNSEHAASISVQLKAKSNDLDICVNELIDTIEGNKAAKNYRSKSAKTKANILNFPKEAKIA